MKGNPEKRELQVSTGDRFLLYVLQRAPVRIVKTLRHLCVSDLASNKNRFFLVLGQHTHSDAEMHKSMFRG